MNFPASLFITNNYDVIAKHFFSQSKLDTSLKNVDSENVVIITPENNRYLKSFEYSFLYENKNQSYVKLEFIDIDGRFEENFLRNSTVRTILRKAYADAFKSGKIKILNDRLNDKAPILPLIFFSFGIGDDLNNWSAPMVANLTDTRIEISSDGLRTILYTFSPIPCPLLTPVMDISQDKADKYSFMYHLNGNVEAYGEHVTTLEELEKSPHIHIKKVLEDYFAKVANTRNQVLLFPDLTEKFKLEVDKNKESLSTEKAGTFLEPPPDRFEFPLEREARLLRSRNAFVSNESSSSEIRIRAMQKTMTVLGICCNEVLPKPLILEKENIAYGPNITDLILEKSQKDFLRDHPDGKGTLLTLRFGIDTIETQSQYPTRSTIPDYFLPLKKFEDGYTQIMGSGFNDSFILSTENDLQVLKFWKIKNIILDSGVPALIFGTVQAIGDYLYLQLAGTSLIEIVNFKSKVKLTDEETAIFDKAYKLAMVGYLFKGKSNSSFNEALPLSEDELSYTTRVFVDTNRKVDIPLFTHNTSNSNILALRLTNSDTYVNAMSFAIREDISKYLAEAIGNEIGGTFITDLLTRDLSKDPQFIDFSSEAKKNPLLDISDSTGRDNLVNFEKLYLVKRIEETLKAHSKFPGSEYEVAKTIILWNDYNKKNSDRISIRPGFGGKDSASFQGRLYQHLRESMIELNIKTLPFFTISNAASTMFRPAMVISKRLQTMGVNDTFIKEDFINEMYGITGYRHVINTSEAYSEFTLMRKFPNLKEILDSRRIKEEVIKTNKVNSSSKENK